MTPTIDVALDFLDTAGQPGERRAERLGSPAALVDWLAGRSLAQRTVEVLRASPADAAHLRSEALRLRDAGARALDAFSAGHPLPPDALHAIDRVLGSSRVSRRLLGDSGTPRLFEVETGGALSAALGPVALGLAQLLTGADRRRVRRCAAPDCRAWFVDTSKGGRRRWCSMERCGNRAKAARHRKRQRAARP